MSAPREARLLTLVIEHGRNKLVGDVVVFARDEAEALDRYLVDLDARDVLRTCVTLALCPLCDREVEARRQRSEGDDVVCSGHVCDCGWAGEPS